MLPGVTVTITNLGTGTERSWHERKRSVSRAAVAARHLPRRRRAPGFKRFEQSGITLSVGQTAVVNATLPVGTVSETITVIANSPLIDTARIDIGHTMTDLEVHNLPLVARNPYNFALAQPGVTGIGNVEFGVPRLAANGAAMRINYQIDGNTNTEKDRAGLRLLPMSEVMIQEVKVVTTGFAPEFGQTMGMVFNAVTPSGTNKFRGEAKLSVPAEGVQRVSVLLRLRQHDAGGELPGDCRERRQSRNEGRYRHGRTSVDPSSRTRCSSTAAGNRRGVTCRRPA